MLKIVLVTLAVACLSPSAAVAQGRGAAPVIFTSGDWTVRRNKDSMTDKVMCTGLYLDRFDVQLASDSFYIVLRGRGGVKAYTLRLDERQATEMQIPSKVEKEISSIGIRGPQFREILGAQRLRAKILTVLNSTVLEDVSLLGVPEAHAVITGPECKGP